MRKLILLLSFFCSICIQSQNTRVTEESPFILGDVIIQFEKNENPQNVINRIDRDYNLQFIKQLSKPVNIWLARFDTNQFTHVEVLKSLNQLRGVKHAQNNHRVYMRDEVVPNDPQYSQQWHHKNTGQTGGTVDADISIENAWDVTTGGLNAFGDEIVVCIIESVDLDHPDLVENKWVNTAESATPNGIDDDNNGYIDDYKGWNIEQNNDNIGMAPSGHGTSVAGMIGARGNNSTGVAGANWDVKIMVVAGYSLQEAAVIEAYSYPLAMRQLYNDTNGNEGAFVVATNASWGLDGGDPADAPIWCDFYDTLGEAGILNCGATSNSNINVDVQGDLPTACASPYMIGVGRSDHNDNFAGGFGATTIDLVAPGIDVRTTAGNNGYTTTTGTSFASPLTAGVIGLMYSVPCPSFMAIVNADPQLGADLVRDALLNSVDVLPQLENFFITGGRLNAEAAIDYLLNNFCESDECLIPMNIQLTDLTDTEADLSWIDFGLEDSWEVHYRVEGETDWTVEAITTNTFEFQNLEVCTSYEYFINAICPEDAEQATEIQTFETDGCCISPDVEEITLINLGDDTASIGWENVLAAQAYNVRYRLEGTSEWELEEDIDDLEILIENLGLCETYEVQVQTICNGGELPEFSETFLFTSAGCDVCSSLTYCASSGENSSDEWIESFSINNFTNTSGNNGGYFDFTGTPITYLTKGEEATISITPGFGGQTYDEYARIWIDFNQDGIFTDEELVLDPGDSFTTTLSAQISIPETALIGTTRMRVSMKYFSEGFFPSPPPEACEVFTFGEVEDYCVTIGNACEIEVTGIVNPVGCNGELGSIELIFEDQLIQDTSTILWDDASTGIEITDLEVGTYSVSITNEEGCIVNLSFELNTAETPQANFEFIQNANLVNFTNLTESISDDANVEWDFGNGSTSTELNPDFMFTETGTYTVCLTLTDDCGTTTFCDDILIETLSIAGFTNANQLQIYPNPVENNFKLEFENIQVNEVQLFDMTGRKLSSFKTQNQQLEVNMSKFETGIYFVVAYDQNAKVIAASKVIKK